MEIVRKISVKETCPNVSGWYDTNKGNLYWNGKEEVWSCRSDRVSEEYPMWWLEEYLEAKLVVGTKIKLGKLYCEHTGQPKEVDTVITLVKGEFEYDNGLYTEIQNAPSVYNENQKDFDSIYHLFGNDLEDFMDCEIVS